MLPVGQSLDLLLSSVTLVPEQVDGSPCLLSQRQACPVDTPRNLPSDYFIVFPISSTF